MGRQLGNILIALILAIGWDVAHAARRDAAETEFQQAKTRYYQLITSNHSGDETEWKICAELFRKFSLSYPQNRRGGEAMFTEALLYSNMHQRFGRNESLYQAINAYEKLANSLPQNSLADDALYNIAIIYFEDLGEKNRAAQVLERLRSSYPRSELSSQAKQLLEKLRASDQENMVLAAPPVSQTLAQSSANLSPAKPQTPIATPTVTPMITKDKPATIKVDEIRTWSNPDYTRVSIYLSGKGDFDHRFLKRDTQQNTPYRLYIDIPNAKLTGNAKREIVIKDSLLERVRSGQFDSDTARVVLDMTSVYDYQISSRADPYRIIIDVQGSEPTPSPLAKLPSQPTEATLPGAPTMAPTLAAPSAVVTPPAQENHEDRGEQEVVAILQGVEKSLPRKENLVDLKSVPNQRTIVLDPGHGGDDPGAKGPAGTMEKEVVLNIALKLRDFLTTYRGIRVVMTRDSDVFIPLEKRSLIANQERGDLFISIHANASPKQKVSGISTYVFDNAQDEYSKRLEEMENASIGRGEKKEPDFLKLMFRSMTKNYFTNQSIELAAAIQEAMIHGLRPRYNTINNLGVRQAMFYVLWNTEMPAILVEASFITNRTEENRLRSDPYQLDIARSIANGLEGYLEQRYAMQLSRR